MYFFTFSLLCTVGYLEEKDPGMIGDGVSDTGIVLNGDGFMGPKSLQQPLLFSNQSSSHSTTPTTAFRGQLSKKRNN